MTISSKDSKRRPLSASERNVFHQGSFTIPRLVLLLLFRPILQVLRNESPFFRQFFSETFAGEGLSVAGTGLDAQEYRSIIALAML